MKKISVRAQDLAAEMARKRQPDSVMVNFLVKPEDVAMGIDEWQATVESRLLEISQHPALSIPELRRQPASPEQESPNWTAMAGDYAAQIESLARERDDRGLNQALGIVKAAQRAIESRGDERIDAIDGLRDAFEGLKRRDAEVPL